ncbi:hypothetical protein R6Q59_024088 [Mikania micrantha]
MGILMLVMMVCTRKRHEEDSQIPTNQSVSKGSGYVCAKRRHKNKSLNIAEQPIVVEQQTAFERQAVAEQPFTELPAEEQPAADEQRVDPRRRHGPNINHRVARSLQNFPQGASLSYCDRIIFLWSMLILDCAPSVNDSRCIESALEEEQR